MNGGKNQLIVLLLHLCILTNTLPDVTAKGGIKEGHLLKKQKKALSGGWHRNYYVLKEGWLFCYKSKMVCYSLTRAPDKNNRANHIIQELDESNALNIMLCSVRVPITLPQASEPNAGCRFEILNPAKKYPIILQAETEKERNEWVTAIQNAISSTLNAQSVDKSVDVVCFYCWCVGVSARGM